MKRFLPFTIMMTTVLAALLVIVVQPQQTAVQKKRLKDMRQFLLAQTDHPYADCDIYMQEHPEYYSACIGWQNDDLNSPTRNYDSNRNNDSQGTLTPAKELECLQFLHKSSFDPVWQQYGMPNANPTNMQLKIKEICAYLQVSTGDRGGVDTIALNAAAQKIKAIVYAFLRNTPGPDKKQPFFFDAYIKEIAYPYIQKGHAIIKEFAHFTLTNPYLISISLDISPYYSPSIEKLEKDLALLIQKPETPVVEKTPAPQENRATKIPPPALATPAQPVISTNIVIRTINKFIKALKEGFLNIRERGPQRRALSRTNLNTKQFNRNIEKLLRYFNYNYHH